MFNKTFSFIFSYTNLEILRNLQAQNNNIMGVPVLLTARIITDLFSLSKEILSESMQKKRLKWTALCGVLIIRKKVEALSAIFTTTA